MRVLIVCPQFAPNNTADSHRVRLLLPHLHKHGCDVEVLAVDPRDVRGPVDPWLAERVPQTVPMHRVRAWPLRGWGLNGLAQRAMVPIYRKGSQLLALGRFDLVFFSTTRFHLHVLGPLWQRRFGVPFCMDYQDPWVNDYYRNHPEIVPPGGRIKYGLSDWLHRAGERNVVRRCSGFLAVSQAYLQSLTDRYGPAAAHQPRLVKPFPAEPAEFEDLLSAAASKTQRGGRSRLIRYIGRGGPDMATAARAFFQAWRELIDRGVLSPEAIRFEAIGTSYYADRAPQPTLAPIAASEGLGDLVTEQPQRLSYRETLTALLAADALVVFGSDDPAYTASKIYPYLLARRPLLAVFQAQSSVVSLLDDVGGAHCARFDTTGLKEGAATAMRQFFRDVDTGNEAVPMDLDAFSKYCADAQAVAIAEWFHTMLGRRGNSRNLAGRQMRLDQA